MAMVKLQREPAGLSITYMGREKAKFVVIMRR